MSPDFPVPYDLPVFPPCLAELRPPLRAVTVLGDFSPPAGPVVAIVGTRTPCEAALEVTTHLARACVQAGAVVVSGGALGVDARAHEATLEAGGRTWAVLPTGPLHLVPSELRPLFERIATNRGALIWPFPPTYGVPLYFARNRVLAALADELVIVEADFRSGSRNAAKWAREMGRPVWAVAPSPWVEGFDGNRLEIERGARPLMSIEGFLRGSKLAPSATQLSLALPEARRPPPLLAGAPPERATIFSTPSRTALPPRPSRPLNPEEKRLAEAATTAPRHLDELLLEAGLTPAQAATPLLTLVLEHVLVEGPTGHYRRPP